MKETLFSLIFLISTSVIFHSKAQTQKNDSCDFFDTVVNSHNQIFQSSGIPSAIEMALKYCKVVDFKFYDLQNEWQNKTDGSFRDFHNKELYGITFSQKFNLPRDASFPLDSLFQTIENELKSGKKVIIALQADQGWPIFVIYKRTPDGEFVSYSKSGTHTLILRNTKEIVKKSNGTEIMTYSISHPGAQAQKIDNCGFFNTVVNNHDQIFQLSCIPSAVEMILKYYKVVDFDFYDLQNEWKNKTDGSFRNFDNKELYGITFFQKFVLPRDASFPIDSLFRTIENELKSEKKVIISLPADTGWHMFVISEQTPDGEFVSYSKLGSHTLILRNTKEIVKKSKGTEIMTYSTPARL